MTPDEEQALRHQLALDFVFYAERNLKIAAKSGRIEPYRLNRAQIYIHTLLEKQLKETGRIRALVLKARQQGCTTYVQGRYYWRVTNRSGVNAYILSHATDTTNKIFKITQRFHAHCDDFVKLPTRAASAKELAFDVVDSTYYVGTAGAKETGRGGTIQFFHGSEVAFWANAESHMAGIMQSVPTGLYADDTEVILESTANGVGNHFHSMWQAAESGESEYLAIFTPWYWQDEYRTRCPLDFEFDYDIIEAAELYNLVPDQMFWMHNKIIELGSTWRFKQEYPAVAAEAFQASGDEAYIGSELVLPAMQCEDELARVGPRIGGLDPAYKREASDRTSFCTRQGRVVTDVTSYHGKDTQEVTGLAIKYMDEQDLDVLFIDTSGASIGAAIYDNLVYAGYGDRVRGVQAGGKAIESDVYMNKRAEMWAMGKTWLEDGPVKLPYLDSLLGDLIAPGYGGDARGRLKIESKENLRSRGVRSSDEADAFLMTFAEKVSPRLKSPRGSVIVNTDYDILGH